MQEKRIQSVNNLASFVNVTSVNSQKSKALTKECKKCHQQKRSQDFSISGYGAKARRCYKTVCLSCANIEKKQVRRLKKTYPKPMCGTTCEINNCTSTDLCLDHDHLTGGFRGWVCRNHNTAIGLMGDSLEGAICVAQYMRKHSASKIDDKEIECDMFCRSKNE